MDWKAFLRRNRLPAITACILVCFLGWSMFGRTPKKDAALYLGLVNTSLSDDLTQSLTTDFLRMQGMEESSMEVYRDLYLTDNSESEYFEYTRASAVRILGSIEQKALDVVILNQEAFDAFAQNGYLLDLDNLLPADSPLRAYLVSNIVILEDNMEEAVWDPSVAYTAVTEEFPMALDLNQSFFFQDVGRSTPAYVSILANSPRIETAQDYLSYLFAP